MWICHDRALSYYGCEEVPNEIIKTKSNPNPVKQNFKNPNPIQIHQSAENPQDFNRNSNPRSSLQCSAQSMDPAYPITHWARPIYREPLLQSGFADEKSCVCGDIQTTSTNHILKHCTVLTPPCSGTNTTFDEDLMEYLILLFRSNRILLLALRLRKRRCIAYARSGTCFIFTRTFIGLLATYSSWNWMFDCRYSVTYIMVSIVRLRVVEGESVLAKNKLENYNVSKNHRVQMWSHERS